MSRPVKSPRRAIVFCNGIRQRTIDESGGADLLAAHFEALVDVSCFSKPWEASLAFDDRVAGQETVRLDSVADARGYFAANAFDYVLIVGLEWSRERQGLVEAITASGSDWGLLFVRGDMRDLFDRRRYDMRSIWGLRQRLRRWQKARGIRTPPPRHLFTNEPLALDFPEVDYGKTEIVPVKHNDAMRLDRAEPAAGPPAIVFADQALTLTFADTPANTGEPRFYDEARAARYHEALNGALTALGRAKGLPVVACLHPNAPSSAAGRFAEEIEVVRGGTIEQICRAALVITHTSMASGFCHLLQKPLLLLSLEQDLMPEKVLRTLKRKARNERLEVLNWPEDDFRDLAVAPAGQAEIRNFLRPAGGTSLGQIFETYFQN